LTAELWRVSSPSRQEYSDSCRQLRFVFRFVFDDLLFSVTWLALFFSSFPLCFFGVFFIFNNFASFVSALFPVCFLAHPLFSTTPPLRFLKKGFLDDVFSEVQGAMPRFFDVF